MGPGNMLGCVYMHTILHLCPGGVAGDAYVMLCRHASGEVQADSRLLNY